MHNNKVRALISDAPDLVTSSTARLEDILLYANVSPHILEKFYDYWQSETDAAKKLAEAFTHLNFGYLQSDAIPHEVRRRMEIGREQARLYEQEYELQMALEEA
jgi:hypothetical protein